MLSRVDFVPACLAERHDQASTEAAAHKYSHYAEVQDHSALGVHVLHAGYSYIVVMILVSSLSLLL